MPWVCITASSVPRRPSRPPCTRGCSVLTRPSMISGKPVYADTSVTGRPERRSSSAVPPVDSSVMPRATSACASSTTPVLSETLMSARRIGVRPAAPPGRSFDEVIVLELAPERAAIDAEDLGGTALVALGIAHDRAEQRFLDLAHHERVQPGRPVAVQPLEVGAERGLGVVAQRHLAGAVAAWRSRRDVASRPH